MYGDVTDVVVFVVSCREDLVNRHRTQVLGPRQARREEPKLPELGAVRTMFRHPLADLSTVVQLLSYILRLVPRSRPQKRWTKGRVEQVRLVAQFPAIETVLESGTDVWSRTQHRLPPFCGIVGEVEAMTVPHSWPGMVALEKRWANEQ